MKTRSPRWKAILLLFSLCAVADFVIGYMNGRSVGYAFGRVFIGLFGTAFLAWLLGIFRNDSNDEEEVNSHKRQ